MPKSLCGDERWAVIPDFSAYEASDLGRVRRILDNRILIQSSYPNKYLIVMLRRNGVQVKCRVNRLILMAFSGPPVPANAHAAHENNIRFDNRLCNLSWKTPKENQADQVRHGTRPFGEKSGTAILKSRDIPTIKSFMLAGYTLRSIAARYGVSIQAISCIREGKTWNHIGAPANFLRLNKKKRSELLSLGGQS